MQLRLRLITLAWLFKVQFVPHEHIFNDDIMLYVITWQAGVSFVNLGGHGVEHFLRKPRETMRRTRYGKMPISKPIIKVIPKKVWQLKRL